MNEEHADNLSAPSPDDEDVRDESAGRGEIVLYQTADGLTRLECRFEDESIWLSQALMASLYQRDVRTISEHLKSIYAEGELDVGATLRKFRIVRSEGSRQVIREIDHYSLDVILAVGYRVRSPSGTQFRRWATERLREYLVKGFVMDDERLRSAPDPAHGIPDYFDELLARIRDIRASEQRMYLRVREIFRLAADYDSSSEQTSKFFSVMQNKLHFAVTGMTAAELIHDRADAKLPNMGLTVWKSDEVRKTDIAVAKNYLNAEEVDGLNRIVVMWLDYSEDQAIRRKQIFMQDWKLKLNEFLKFNERKVLTHAGKVSKANAEVHAKEQYEQFANRRRKFKELQGAEDNMRALEDSVKKLPKRKKDGGNKGSSQ